MMTREQLTAYYQQEADALQTKINSLKARSRGFVAAEIASFLAIIFFTVLITLSDSQLAKAVEGLLAVAMFALYVIVRNRDVKNSERTAETERLRKAHEHEAAYLSGDFTAFDDGQRYVDPSHPFTYDMDIFGKESLYQRASRAVTTGGADRLAALFSSVGTHKTIEEINNYHEAINELSGSTAWRMHFIARGVDRKIDTDAILQSLPKLQKIAIPSYFDGKIVKAVACADVVCFFASIVAAIYGFVNPLLPIFWLFVNFFVVQGLANKYLREMLKLGNRLHGQMQPLMKLVNHVVDGEKEEQQTAKQMLQSSVLKKDASKLKEAVDSFDSLTNIVETLILRGSDAYRFFADALGLRGLFLVSNFYHWRQIASDNLPEWITAVTDLDSLVSMAQFKANHPEAGSAEVIDSSEQSQTDTEVTFEAKGLWHPFLGSKAVRNDFSIADRNFYIITGANMAGKSTFLRAVGVNYILAMNGMPVFAESLTVSRYRLFTSMRTSDDLAHGISYFNAELLRLKQLIESLSSPEKTTNERQLPTLIILDEILKGTNSLDKLNGSRLFLQNITQYPVSGIIATHDLELSKMEQEDKRFHNYCFEIQLGTDVTYSYKITPGVAQNQNATFLLKHLLDGNMR